MIRRTSWPLTPRKLAQRVRKSPRRIHWVGTRSPPRGWDLGVRSAGSAVGAREVRGIAWAPPSSPSFPVTAQTAVSCAGFVRHGAPPLRPAPSPWSFAPAAGQTGGATRVCALQVPLVASRTLSPCSFPAWTTASLPQPSARRGGVGPSRGEGRALSVIPTVRRRALPSRGQPGLAELRFRLARWPASRPPRWVLDGTVLADREEFGRADGLEGSCTFAWRPSFSLPGKRF